MRILLLITSTVLRAKKKCFNFQMVMEWLINSYSSLFVSSFLICTDSSDEHTKPSTMPMWLRILGNQSYTNSND